MTLAEWIIAQKMSRTAAAARLGVAKGYLTELCQRKKEPSLAVAARIIKESRGRITIDELMIPRGIKGAAE